MSITYDPKEYVQQLQRIFVSDNKQIGFLFGTGTSMAIKRGATNEKHKVPCLEEMSLKIREVINKKEYKNTISTIEDELKDAKANCNIENILSLIIQKSLAVGKEKLCGLDKCGLEALSNEIKGEIIKLVAVHHKKEDFVCDLIHCDLVSWISEAVRKYPIEIFTTNYDLLFEIGFEYKKVPFFDGFVGSHEPFFYVNSVDNMNFLKEFTKLWKMHGSLGWYAKDNNIIRGKSPNSDLRDVIIYPSFLKYDDARKQPYNAFLERLSKFIKTDDSVLFINGYSFGDKHINDIIFSALDQSKNSYIFAFFYDKKNEKGKTIYELESNTALREIALKHSKISIYGYKGAYIGGKYGTWKLKSVPTLTDSIVIDYYFDIFAPIPKLDKGQDEYHDYSGDGEFVLPDFAKFVEFISSTNYEKQRKEFTKR